MLINAYRFGGISAPGSNIPTLIQNTAAFKLDNATANNDFFVMNGVKVGSTVVVVVHHMMLNGNNDATIISDNAQATSYAQQVKSIAGTAGGLAHKGSVVIHKSDPFKTTDFGGASSGDIKIFTKSADANLANIRMHYYGLEISNIALGDVVLGTDTFATNVGTNLGNSTPNVFMSNWSHKNTFIIAAATGLQNNQFSFNTSTYPATSHGGPTWNPLWIKNEASGTATGNCRSISNYLVSTSNSSTLISDWVTAFSTTGAGAPWAAVIIALPAT